MMPSNRRLKTGHMKAVIVSLLRRHDVNQMFWRAGVSARHNARRGNTLAGTVARPPKDFFQDTVIILRMKPIRDWSLLSKILFSALFLLMMILVPEMILKSYFWKSTTRAT